ncbi:hypothetical protein [Clostridium perfringens]|nr:hypothetical protein [Clostridium perfringens]
MLKMKMYAELIGNYKNIRIKSLMGNKIVNIEEAALLNDELWC